MVFALVFAFAACGSKSSYAKSIVGNWKAGAAEIAYVFNDDGTYYYYMSTLKLTGTYSLSKEDKITLNSDTSPEEKEYNVKIKKDVLYMYTDDQEPENGIVLTKVETLSMASIDEVISSLNENKTTTQAPEK